MGVFYKTIVSFWEFTQVSRYRKVLNNLLTPGVHIMKSNKLRKSFALSIATVLAVLPNAVFASTPPLSLKNDAVSTNSSANSVEAYWTPQKLKTAKSLDLPTASGSVPKTPVLTTGATGGASVTGAGKAPTINVAPNTQPLFSPQAQTANNTPQPNNYGTQNAQFTSSRLIPLSADREYPYRAVGKLFFSDQSGGNYVCSGAVLRPRIVLTAGHCVHKGSGGSNGFYKNFLFIPAYRDGMAPYGKWSWRWVITTGEWANGKGNVPNAADFAIIEVQDQSNKKIADLTGYFGYRTQALLPNHATLLGYPCNLDSCEKMHQVTAESYSSGGSNTVLYGSDMRGGSSGGPWVQNFGAPATGQTAGKNTGVNQIIGVTSYGYVSTEPLVQGSSILNQSFLNILDSACKAKPGNC